MYSLRLFFFLGVSCALVSTFFPGCASGTRGESLQNSKGEEIRWTPEKPKIGDLVQLEALGDADLFGPDGSVIPPAFVDHLDAGIQSSWKFRIKTSGDWQWGKAESRQTLWSTASVAGEATEIKKLDGSSLWSGRKAAP